MINRPRIKLSLLFAVVLALCPATRLQAQERLEIPKDLLEAKSPPLLLTPAEIQELKTRIASEPAARRMYDNLLQTVNGYIDKPLRFPELEGGWTHHYVCSECSSGMRYREESPRLHVCTECGKEAQSERLDQAWNSTTFGRVAARMEDLAAAALLSGEPRIAAALKEAWLDVARKYPKYRPHEKDMRFPKDPVSTSGRATSQSIEESDLLSKLAYSWDALLATNTLSNKERELIEKNVWAIANAYFHRVLELRGSGGNWWVWHNTGALATGIVTRDAKLIDQAFNMPKSGILAMLTAGYIREDGLVDERSAGYQSYAMKALSRMTHLSKRVGIPFYENPRVKAAFTACTQLLLPDMSIPCMNDGWLVRFRDPKGAIGFSDILDLGWGIYRSPEILQTLRILQGSPAFAKEREDSLYSLLYGPTDLEPAPLELPPVYLPASGIALLRSPDKDWTLLFKNNPKPEGHAHPNALHFSMFANGEEFVPSFGTPGYGSPYYLAWYARTLAANTVAFNMACQSMRDIQNRMDWGVIRGPVQAVHGSSRKVQVAGDPGPAIQLSRVALLTPLAMYEILRVEPDAKLKKKATLPTNGLESLIRYNGTLSWVSAPTVAEVPWKLPALDSLKAAFEKEHGKHKRFRDPVAPYRFLQKPERLPANGDFLRAELSQPKGGKVALALFPQIEGESVWQFMSPGYQDHPTHLMPMVMRRVSANQARFGSVAVPFQGENNPLRAVKLLVDTPSASVLRVETNTGTEIVLQSARAGELAVAEAQLEFNGSLGVITEAGGNRIYTLVGTALGDSAGKLTVDVPGSVQVRLEGGKPSFSNLGNQPVTIRWEPAGGKPVTQQIQAQGAE